MTGWATLLATLLLFASGCGDADPPAVGTLERDRLELVAEASEPIVEILVREGQDVEAGQVLLRLERRRLDANVAAARAARDQAAARLAEATRGPRSERIREARARLDGAQSAVVTAARELERVQKLAADDVASRSRLDEWTNRHEEARARRAEARASLEALLEGTTPEELDQFEAQLAAGEAGLADAEIRLERLTVRAPTAGSVDALPFEVGERPPQGGVVVVLLATGAPYGRVHVPAPVRLRLSPGAPALVSVDGVDEPLRGRVRFVSHDADFTPYFALTRHDRSRLSYLAEVDLLDPQARELPTGIPVEVRFPTAADSEAGEVAGAP